MSAALEVRDVTVEIGVARVLDAVGLVVASGEVVALVGPNGAGKSTLLGVLAGDLDPTAGEVLVHGRPAGEYGARALARRRAVLLQQQGLAFGFSVADVVRMGRSPWHRTRRADADDVVVEAAMNRADMTAFATRLFPTLSGGEQARTSFARVLAQETDIVLLDEPTAALDLRHQESLLTVARGSAHAGAAVGVVLHDLSLAAAYADRICVLADGRGRAVGSPREVLRADLLTEVYQHPVQVLDHEGTPVVVPVRTGVACASCS